MTEDHFAQGLIAAALLIVGVLGYATWYGATVTACRGTGGHPAYVTNGRPQLFPDFVCERP